MIFATLGIGSFFSNFIRFSLAVIGDKVMADTGLNVSHIAIISAAVFYPYAALQIPAGIAGDRVSTRKLITFACFVTGLGSLIFSMSPGLWGMAGGRFLVGIGTSFVYVPALAVMRREFGDARYGQVAGLFMAFGGSGNIISTAPLSILIEYVSWRTIYTAAGGILIATAIAAFMAVPDSRGEVRKREPGELRPLLSVGYLSICIWFFVTIGTNLAFVSLWAGPFFTRSLGLSARASGLCLMGMSIGKIVGGMVLGRMSDKFGSIRSLVVGSMLYAATTAVLGFLPEQQSAWLPMTLNFMAGVFNNAACVAAFTSMKLFVSPRNTGLASGICNCWNFVGTALLTQLSGNIMQLSSGSTHDQFALLLSMFSVMVVMSAIFAGLANRGKEHAR